MEHLQFFVEQKMNPTSAEERCSKAVSRCGQNDASSPYLNWTGLCLKSDGFIPVIVHRRRFPMVSRGGVTSDIAEKFY